MNNLPPGCSVSDIPGNRPEDAEWDALFDWLLESGLEPQEIRAAIIAARPSPRP